MKFSASDAAVTVLTLLLAGVLVFLYVQDSNRVTVRTGEQPLGTIVFKKQNATRRIRDGLVWERVRNNSPVYEADTLRTADASEASVMFDDGTSLDMYENSMLKVDFSKDERTFEFLGGDISVSGPSGADAAELSGLSASRDSKARNAYVIKSGGNAVTVQEGSKASLSRTGDSLNIEVGEGEVSFTNAVGGVETLDRTKTLQVDLASGVSQVTERSLLPVAPEQNARFIFRQPGNAELEFSWDMKGVDTATLELSQTRDFGIEPISMTVTGNSVRREIAPGTWYWRLRTPDGTVSSERRFGLISELPPQPILPASGADFSYRKKLPEIRFSWTAMENAAAYIFEIASDPAFAAPERRNRTNLENLAVDSLGEGTWYWRVVPVLPMTVLGTAPEPEVRSVTIRRRAEMAALSPSMPLHGSLFLIEEAGEKGIGFSWKPEPEAVGYELAVSGSEDLRDPVVSRTSPEAWLTLSGSDAEPLAAAGTWFWAVRWKDREGNISRYSEPRRIQGVDGKIAARLSFPPDGYVIADSLVTSTRFAWKSNVNAKTVFLLSSDPSFSTVEWEEPADTGTIIGKRWKPGTWYWRLRLLNVNGSVLFETPARAFRVVEPLPRPRLVAPASEGVLHIGKDESLTVSWERVDGADYYRFALYSVSDSGNETLTYSSPPTNNTELELPFGTYRPGKKRFQIQAFCLDKESSTRIIGYRAEYDFQTRILSRMTLGSPADGTAFDGLYARRNGIRLSWNVPDAPETSELVVSGDPYGRTVLIRGSASSGTRLLESLPAGEYFWTVKGTLGGVDLSSLDIGRFTIDPIPPLSKPAGLKPVRGFTYGPNELRGVSSLRFSWNPVQDATHYIFSLFRENETLPVVTTKPFAGCEYSLNDLTVLDPGPYRWTVEAFGLDSNGRTDQSGPPGESGFRIELPKIIVPPSKGKETFYGR